MLCGTPFLPRDQARKPCHCEERSDAAPERIARGSALGVQFPGKMYIFYGKMIDFWKKVIII